MPRLAGQPAVYMETALKRFRQMNPQQDNSPMIGVAKALSDSDISAVATYLQGR
jgi:cytochrome c553